MAVYSSSSYTRLLTVNHPPVLETVLEVKNLAIFVNVVIILKFSAI